MRLRASGAAAEPEQERNEQYQPDDSDNDPGVGEEEQQDDPDEDQDERKWQHEAVLPAAQRPKLQIEHDQPVFGQLAHRVGGALASVSGVLDPAVGHLVGPEGWRLVDRDATELEPLGGLQRGRDARGEDPRLQPVTRAVRELDRFLQRPEGVDRANGAEDLLAAD